MKVSENITKTTLPGIKNIYRYINGEEKLYADAVELDGYGAPEIIYHPWQPGKHCLLNGYSYERIIQKVMDKGTVTSEFSLEESASYAIKRLIQVPEETKRFDNPHIYKVGIGKELVGLRNNLKEIIWKH